MGVFENIRNEKNVAKQPVVKAKKRLHKGFLFGHISNGGGLVRLDDEYALKFTAIDDKTVVIHLLDYGKDLKMEAQTWRKTKTVEREIVNKKLMSEETKEENLF